jgi:hypothetical protein
VAGRLLLLLLACFSLVTPPVACGFLNWNDKLQCLLGSLSGMPINFSENQCYLIDYEKATFSLMSLAAVIGVDIS